MNLLIFLVLVSRVVTLSEREMERSQQKVEHHQSSPNQQKQEEERSNARSSKVEQSIDHQEKTLPLPHLTYSLDSSGEEIALIDPKYFTMVKVDYTKKGERSSKGKSSKKERKKEL